MQLVSSFSTLVLEEVGANLCMGPIVKIGTWNSFFSCVNEDFSRQSIVFQMTAELDLMLRRLRTACKKFSEVPNLELVGRSLNFRG